MLHTCISHPLPVVNIVKIPLIMPSCVVKTCRNHSGYMKKSQGITFHRFPKGNNAWRDDWIQIIRKCRNENDWHPSKSSVVCNVHFEAKDLYTTKCGLLRIVSYAVPKMFLSEPEYILDGQPPDQNTSNCLPQSSSVKSNSVSQSSSRNGSVNPSSCLIQVLFEPEYILDGEPPEPKTLCQLQENFAALRSNTVQPSTSEQSDSQNSTSCLLQNAAKTEPVEVENNLVLNSPKTEKVNNFMLNSPKIDREEVENNFISNSPKNEMLEVEIDMRQPPLALCNLKKRHLRHKLIKMQVLLDLQKKKIKTLNQRVRRLLIRNKSLKNILASRKEEKKTS